MSTVAEIEAAIEQLPANQVEDLARWLDLFRSRLSGSAKSASLDSWIAGARGAAKAGVTTAAVMSATRGEE